MSGAVHSKLILFEREMGGSPAVFEKIGEVTNWAGPNMTAPTDETTSFDSTWGEHLVGVPDGGSVTVAFNWVPTDGPQQRVRADFENGTLRTYRVRKADGTLPAVSFSGYITALSPSAALNQKIAGSMTLKVTGEVD